MTRKDSIFAWLSLLLGYLFCRCFPVTYHPFGGFLFIIVLFALTAVFLKLRGIRFSLMPILALSSAILVCTALILTSNPTIHFFSYTYCIIAYTYFIFSSFGNTLEKGFCDTLLIDFFKALIIAPFTSFTAIFQALRSKKDANGKTLVNIIIGIAVTILPVTIIISMLSYDKGFYSLLTKLFNNFFSEAFSHLFSFLLGIPVAMYIFGLFTASAQHNCKDILPLDICRKNSADLKIIPAATSLTAVLPIIAVYIIFFISQWKYYVSGFIGVLPDSTSYAQYAREGFFQLLWVSFINLLIIGALSLFMKRKAEKATILQRVISITLSVCTLILITTAIAKMIMYINIYGLTPKRVYASWFMLLLAVIFIITILKAIFTSLRAVVLSVSAVVIAFIAISVVNTDEIIAEYNVNRYIEGTLSEYDGETLMNLGDSAVPSIVKLVKHLDKKNGTDVLSYTPTFSDDFGNYKKLCGYLFDKSEEFLDGSIWKLTVPQIKAESALDDLGMTDKVKDYLEEQKKAKKES